MLQGYQPYLISTAKEGQLADIKTRALTVSMIVLSIIGFMTAFAAVSVILGRAATSIND